MKRVILITGTPCVGKTTTAKSLATKLGAQYINLTDFAKTYNLTSGEDEERHTTIIDEAAMRLKLKENIAGIQRSLPKNHSVVTMLIVDNKTNLT